MIYNEGEILKLVEVAKMYYEENMTQANIAKNLKVSRPLISKMLTKARELGIVHIEIKSPYTSNTFLANQLKSLFNLQGGIITPQANTEYLTEQLILAHAFHYIEDILNEVNYLGLGWGYEIEALIKKIESSASIQNFKGEICPLIGSASIPNRGYHPNEIVRVFSEKTGGTPHYIFAPAFPATKDEQGLYVHTDNYHNIFKIWSILDTVIVSIDTYPSVPDQATALRFGKSLHEKKAVGMILSYYFDKLGNIIKGENDYAIHIPLEKLKKIKRVIGICTNTNNIYSIIGALQTGLLTHLITDEQTASNIIKNQT
ncbi:sugar-binding transcriptional regulator [Crassaminicella profunda]|uniref:sugar-binding transcriptional regulator n=1 Tax=Crassaminicella profunda TaxID=1286698 RepID=UPI001CA797C4|nr:sugar-binding domain-containing protein [Crassaminicella profunda]QZY54415.1 transcriptional regulator [Crassaminicella profunda]